MECPLHPDGPGVGTSRPRDREQRARLNLGDNLLALGRLDEAEEQFRWVERVYRDPQPADHLMLWRYSQHMLHSHGELWLQRGDAGRALAYADECLEKAFESESLKNVVKARRLRGQALQAQGQLGLPGEEFEAALSIATEIGNPNQLWRTHAAIGDLVGVRSDTEAADEAYRAALGVIDGVAERLDGERAATFLAAEPVVAIREALEGVSG